MFLIFFIYLYIYLFEYLRTENLKKKNFKIKLNKKKKN